MIQFEITNTPDEADLKVVDNGLDQYNESHCDFSGVVPLACFARNAAGEVVGGVWARTWGAGCEIRWLWVEETDRLSGLGRKLMENAESEARARGCTLFYLETFSFQARGFYEKLGYKVAVAFTGFPDGVEKYVMQKEIES